MSSSKLLKATVPVGSGSGFGANSTYTINMGRSNPYGYINLSSSSLQTVSQEPVFDWSGGIDAGETVINMWEEENGVRVRAALDIDPSITALESVKLNLLITGVGIQWALNGSMVDVKPISYIRRHGLERHFRFSTE